MWHEPAGVVADEEELGATLRPFQCEGNRFVGGKERCMRGEYQSHPFALLTTAAANLSALRTSNGKNKLGSINSSSNTAGSSF
jgi:hypothetical protein